MAWSGRGVIRRVAYGRGRTRYDDAAGIWPPNGACLGVKGAHLAVEQDRLGHVDAGHARRGNRRARVQIRVVRLGQPPIRGLNVLGGSAGRHAEELVVVSRRVERDARHNSSGRYAPLSFI